MFDKYLSKRAQGVAIMAIGVILFLNATGFIQRGLSSVVIISSIVLMVYGFVQAHAFEYIQSLWNGKKKNH
jgi:hypothetical protein